MNGQPQQQPIRQAGQEEGLPFGWCEFKLQERLDILRQQGFEKPGQNQAEVRRFDQRRNCR